MMKLQIQTLSLGLFLLAGLASACTSDAITSTKAAAKERGGVGEDGQDLCVDNGWYGDGECDVFCPLYDEADCGQACAQVLPTCDENEREVSEQECELLADCNKITSCGGTVYCANDGLVSCPAVEPTCNVDGQVVPPVAPSDCEAPDACTRHEACGGRIYYCPRETPKEDPDKCFVGGCSSQLCSDEPGLASTCEWREEYACYRGASCERQADGACGWTQTEELKACLGGAEEPKPAGPCYVGGCSGQICSAEKGAISTCEWREEYACYRGASCERQADGACGWTQTEELQACLDTSK